MRRKPGALVPLEAAICLVATQLKSKGVHDFHGYEIAKQIGDVSDHRLLTAYGTLYRALDRLETMGLLHSRWEDPEIPARENRPGRRLYSLTPAGALAAREVRQVAPQALKRARRKLAPA